MLNYLKSLSKQSSIYIVAQVLTKATGVILIPFYVAYLSKNDYGIISLVTALVGSLSILYDFGLRSAWYKFFFDHKEGSAEQKTVFSNIFFLFMLISGIITITLLLTFYYNQKTIFSDLSFFPFLLLSILTALFLNGFDFLNSTFRLIEKPIQFASFNFSKFLLVLLSTIFAIGVLKMGASGKVYSELIITIIYFFVALFYFRKYLVFSINFKTIKKIMVYSLPLLPHAISGLIINIADKTIINVHCGLSANAVYNIAFLYSSIISFVMTSINLAWGPFILKLYHTEVDNFKSVVSSIFTYFFFFIISISLILAFGAHEFLYVFTSNKYLEANSIIPILIMSFATNGLFYLISALLYFEAKTTKFVSFITITSAMVNLTLNYFLIPRYGIIGAAYVSLITSMITFILAYIFVQLNYKLKYNYKVLFLIAGMAIICFSTYHFFIKDFEFFLLRVVFKVILVSFFIIFTSRFILHIKVKDLIMKQILRLRN